MAARPSTGRHPQSAGCQTATQGTKAASRATESPHAGSTPANAQDARWLWALLGISLLALVLRALFLDRQSLWLDEAAGLQRGSWPDLRDVVQFGKQTEPSPPLYFVLLHYWLKATAAAPMPARALSVLTGTLSIPAAALLLRRLIGARTALAAALLLAVNPFHIYYSQEVRPYALLLFLYILSCHCLCRALSVRSGSAWFLHWLCTTACAYVHYVGGAAILGHALYVVLAGYARDRGTRNRAAVSLVASAAAVSAWALGPRFFSTVGSILQPHEPPLVAATRLPGILLHLAWDVQVGYFPGLERAPVSLLCLMLSLSLALVVVTAVAWVGLVRSPQRDPAWLLGSLLAAGLCVGAGVVVFTFFKSTRYFLPVLLPGVALEASALRLLWRNRLRLLCVALCCLMGLLTLVSLRNYYLDPDYARRDWRALARYLNDKAHPDDKIVVPLYYYEVPLRTYYTGAAEVLAPSSGEERGDWWNRANPLPPGRAFWLIEVEPKGRPDTSAHNAATVHEFHRLRLTRVPTPP